MEFTEFQKIARLSRDMVVTEKIDGTNGQIAIVPAEGNGVVGSLTRLAVAERDGLVMLVGSRTQWITPERDNFGFARWVQAHAAELFVLGEGRHFGEWWGSGIQRGYGLTNGEKRFSLFNVAKWGDPATRPACCGVVPTLYQGLFSTEAIATEVERLRTLGSVVAPGFMKPEGVVVFHTASSTLYKRTLDKDEKPKSAA